MHCAAKSCRGQVQTLSVPFTQAFLKQPQADDVLKEPDAARHAAFVGESFFPPPVTTGSSRTVPTSDHVPELMKTKSVMGKRNAGHRRTRIVTRRGNHLSILQARFPALTSGRSFPSIVPACTMGGNFSRSRPSADGDFLRPASRPDVQQLRGAGFRILLRRDTRQPVLEILRQGQPARRTVPLLGKLLFVRRQLVNRY